MKIVVTIGLFFLMSTVSFSQDVIRINRIEMTGKDRAQYALLYANGKLLDVIGIQEPDIIKVVDHLKSTGLYESLGWEISRDGDRTRLLLSPKTVHNFKELLIEDVEHNLEGADAERFEIGLVQQGLLPNTSWLTYSFQDLIELVSKAKCDSYRQNSNCEEEVYLTVKKGKSDNGLVLVAKF